MHAVYCCRYPVYTHRHVNGRRILAHVVSDKGIGPNDIQCRDTTDFAWIINALLFENFSGNGDGTIDRITDNGQDSIGTILGTAFDQRLDNTGIRLKIEKSIIYMGEKNSISVKIRRTSRTVG